MPLRDHFHPPLFSRPHWTSLHAAWATCISFNLNRLLPPNYVAEPLCKFIVEIDVATFGEEEKGSETASWSPSAPALTVPIAAATDAAEVRVHYEDGDHALVGCIELVSPSNKDRPAERDAFVSKCVSYLHEGVGLVIVDIVTARRANLHAALLTRLGANCEQVLQADLYATAYRPVRQESQTQLSIWQEELAVGMPLPTMPLWLHDGPCMPVELEETYEQTCRELRVRSNGNQAR